jgi:hypothetical protein
MINMKGVGEGRKGQFFTLSRKGCWSSNFCNLLSHQENCLLVDESNWRNIFVDSYSYFKKGVYGFFHITQSQLTGINTIRNISMWIKGDIFSLVRIFSCDRNGSFVSLIWMGLPKEERVWWSFLPSTLWDMSANLEFHRRSLVTNSQWFKSSPWWNFKMNSSWRPWARSWIRKIKITQAPWPN